MPPALKGAFVFLATRTQCYLTFQIFYGYCCPVGPELIRALDIKLLENFLVMTFTGNLSTLTKATLADSLTCFMKSFMFLILRRSFITLILNIILLRKSMDITLKLN